MTTRQTFDVVNDAVNHPPHYTDGGIETIDFIRAKLSRDEFLGMCKGNVMKYVSRAGRKLDNGTDQTEMTLRDLRKAEKYLQWAIERLESVD